MYPMTAQMMATMGMANDNMTADNGINSSIMFFCLLLIIDVDEHNGKPVFEVVQ
jgi:hypothetical protein